VIVTLNTTIILLQIIHRSVGEPAEGSFLRSSVSTKREFLFKCIDNEDDEV
jgi:hypothetical protein